jgi:membrane-bound lytic murein transglycosylase F
MRNIISRVICVTFTILLICSCSGEHDTKKKVREGDVGKNLPAEPKLLIPDNANILSDISDSLQNKNKSHSGIRRTSKLKIFKGDLPALQKRRYIRVLTRNNPACYYIHRGVSMGFEYELIKKFAEQNNLEVVMIVPPEWDDMITWLLEGRGDIIAGSMALTKRRKNIPGLAFGKTYSSLKQAIFCRKNDKTIKTAADLKGRKVYVRKNSVYWDTLSELRSKGVQFTISEAPQTMETYEIIEAVKKGKFDTTLADIRFINLSTAGKSMATPIIIGDELRYTWAVRKENKQLLHAVNKFFNSEYRGTFYNIIYKRYFNSSRNADKYNDSATEKGAYKFSGYDKIIKKYADKYNLPWYLIAAQIFQESRFNPKAKSWCGTIGLMQLTETTAREMQCNDIHNSEENIKAGVKYMHHLMQRIPGNITDFDRICFALASYNGGYGHLVDARKLSIRQKLNPDIWFNNVEKAMKLLSKKQYYSKAKYGYCRSKEIVNYVKEISLRSREYKQALESEK